MSRIVLARVAFAIGSFVMRCDILDLLCAGLLGVVAFFVLFLYSISSCLVVIVVALRCLALPLVH